MGRKSKTSPQVDAPPPYDDRHYSQPPHNPYYQPPPHHQPPPQHHQPPPPRQPTQPKTRPQRRAPRGVEVSACTKYVLFFINIFFWLVGAFLLAFGIWGLVSKGGNSVSELAEDIGLYLDPMFAFIIVGGLIFMLSFFGCIGSLRENTCMIKFFTYFLILIFLGEITIGVLAYVYQEQLFGALEGWFDTTIEFYYDDPDKQFLMDSFQESLQCCGSSSPNDWQKNIYFNCSSIARSSCSVPYSCCLPQEGVVDYQCGYKVLSLSEDEMKAIIYTNGCAEAMRDWFITNAIILGVCLVSMVIFQCVTICLGRSLVSDIEQVKAYW